MQRYGAYKDSGVEWIGEIPAGWGTSKLRYLARCLNGDRGENYPSGEDMVDDGVAFVTTESIHGPKVDFHKVKRITTERYEALGGVKLAVEDIVYCLRGSVGLCSINLDEEAGSLASSLMAIRSVGCDASWLLYTLCSEVVKVQLKEAMNGTCAANLSAENVSRFILPLPPLPEQQAIADYLDAKTAQIDSIVSQTEHSIGLLREYRKSVISEAVTKGLDPDAPMKDSGVEWIGEIPAGWGVRRIKTVVRRTTESKHPDEQVLSLYRDYGVVIKDSRDDNFNRTSDDTSNYKFVEKGDLVVNKMKAWQGSLAISKFQGIVSPAYHVYKVIDAGVYRGYLHYLLRDKSYLPEYERLSGGIRIGQWDLSAENFLNIPMLIPTYREQQAIADYLDAKTAEIDFLTDAKQRQVELLKEYRKSLISEAVTGKFKVPGLE